jgi:hypothetical protein
VLSILDFHATGCCNCKYFRRKSDDCVGLREDREMTPLGSYNGSDRHSGNLHNNFIKKIKRSASQSLREYIDDATLDNQKCAYVPSELKDSLLNAHKL